MKYVCLFCLICLSGNSTLFSCAEQSRPKFTSVNRLAYTTSLKTIEAEIASKPHKEQILVTIDLDDTLTRANLSLLSCEQQLFFRLLDQAWSECSKLGSKEQAQLKFEKIMLPLVEKYAPTFIAKLQNQNIKVIALTSCGKGSREKLDSPDFMKWRSLMLSKYGIKFTQSFDLDSHKFAHMGTDDNHPTFYDGMLFAHPCDKDVVLRRFIEACSWRPKEIVFIDNDGNTINSIHRTIQSLGINSLGVLYGRATKIPSFDLEIFQFQIKYLIRDDQWLTIDEIYTEKAKEFLLTFNAAKD